MKKFFNNKIMKVYIVLLIVCFISSVVGGGFAISASSQLKKIEEEKKSGSNITQVLTDALKGLADQAAAQKDGEEKPEEKQEEKQEEKEPELTEEEKALTSKKTAGIVVMAVTFVLGVLFSAGAITSYQYEKYLLSDKYKAKLKRLKKYEKMKQK